MGYIIYNTATNYPLGYASDFEDAKNRCDKYAEDIESPVHVVETKIVYSSTTVEHLFKDSEK